MVVPHNAVAAFARPRLLDSLFCFIVCVCALLSCYVFLFLSCASR